MRVWHPDRFAGDPALREKAGKKSQEINEAYRRLARYEDTPPPAPKSAASGPDGRPRRRLALDFAVLALVLALVFGGLYLYFIVKEDSGKMRLGGVTFREWEWDTFFRPGSTKDEVLAVQGAPDRVDGDTWTYAGDTVTFLRGRVARYSNVNGRLRARVLPEKPAAIPSDRFTLGSTRDEVLGAQGSPDRYLGNQWWYGEDSVLFSDGKVSGWSNASGKLRAVPAPVAKNAHER